MTENEIVRSYENAKDKNKQVSILADLEAKTQQEIIEILEKNGAITGLQKIKNNEQKTMVNKKRSKSTEWNIEMINNLTKLKNEGLSYNQIAERMGLNTMAVQNKIRRMKNNNIEYAEYAKEVENPKVSDVKDEYINELENLLQEKEKELQTIKTQNLAFIIFEKLLRADSTKIDKINAIFDII